MADRLAPLFPAALLAVLCAAGCDPPPQAGPPSPAVDVVSYEAFLRLDPEALALEGRATLVVHHPETLAALDLAFGDLRVDRVRVDGRPVDARRRPGGLRVPLATGAARSLVEVSYAGVPETGLYRAEHDGQTVVFTDGWPDRVSGWLPGVHHPADPAAFHLVLDVPPGYEAVASGAPAPPETLATGLRYRWHLDVPAPTYAYAFALADFTVREAAAGDTLPVRYYMLAGDAARADRLARTPEALAFFSELLGPYPYAQYTSVQVPIPFAGMENASASFLEAGLFDGDAAEAVQVHEAAHQWFGNRVVIADWRDLWLSEGTSTYLTTLFYEHADGLDAARRRWADMAALPPGRARTNRALVPGMVADPEAHLTWVPYEKGGSVLHLLRLTAGDEAFFAALRRAYRDYAGRPLSTEAFRSLLEEASGRDLGAVFDVWVYGEALPVLETAWDAAARRLTWRVDGDGGTLAGVPVFLEVRHDGRLHYVPLAEESFSVPAASSPDPPAVRPVGVMLQVDGL